MIDPEELIESVLRDYSSAEPRAGWERRVIVQASRPRPVKWTLLIPAFAVTIIAVISIPRPAPVHPMPMQIVKVDYKPTPSAAPVVRVRQSRVRHARQALPQQPVFPTPTPLTSDERALMSIASSVITEDVLARFVDSNPIQIAPIQITALEKEN